MRKAILVAGFAILSLLVTAGWIYSQMINDQEQKFDAAIQSAKDHTSLVQIDRAEYFAGDDVYSIVFGFDDQEQAIIVWVGSDDIHEEKAADGLSKADIRANVAQRYGDVSWIRLVPGKYNEEYVWEAYFTAVETDGTRPIYEYFRYRDGELLDTLRLKAH